MPHPLINFLQSHRDIPANDVAVIETAFQPHSYREGDYLFRGNTVCRVFFFICKGILRIKAIGDNGVEVTHFFLKENQFCTILNSFNNLVVATESIQAACNVEVLAINRQQLDALCQQLPYLKTLIDKICQQALLDKISIRNSFLGHDAATRYKMFLERQPDIALRVPLADVASYLDITPQSLSRIRKNIR